MTISCDRVRELAPGFVLGALDADEMIAVSDHLDTCPERHPEVDELGGVLPYLAESLQPVEPPVWLRESVIAAARVDLVASRRLGKLSEHGLVDPVVAPASAPAALSAAAEPGRLEAAAGQLVSLARASRRRRFLTWTMRVAAVVAVVTLAGAGIVVQGDLSMALKAQTEDAKINNALTQNDTRTAVMSGVGGSKAGGIAALMPTGHIIVKLYGLAATKNDQVYVVWLTTEQGGPTKVGSFTPDDNGVGYLEVDNVPTSASLWLYVSMEPNNNVTQPTGPTIVSGMVTI